MSGSPEGPTWAAGVAGEAAVPQLKAAQLRNLLEVLALSLEKATAPEANAVNALFQASTIPKQSGAEAAQVLSGVNSVTLPSSEMEYLAGRSQMLRSGRFGTEELTRAGILREDPADDSRVIVDLRRVWEALEAVIRAGAGPTGP